MIKFEWKKKKENGRKDKNLENLSVFFLWFLYNNKKKIYLNYREQKWNCFDPKMK